MTAQSGLKSVNVPMFSGGPTAEAVTIRPGQMYALVESVSPGRAQLILDEANFGTHKLRQRRVSKLAVSEYIGIIERSEWRAVPPGLVFDANDNLLNGQHRLIAQVATGATLPWWVTYNCPGELFALIDTGKKRSMGDIMVMSGAAELTSVGSHLASALRLMHCYERYAAGELTMSWVSWPGIKVSAPQALDVYTRRPAIAESLKVSARVYQAARYNGAAICVWHRLVCDLFPDSAPAVAEFAEQIATGRMLDLGDPAYTLRGWLDRGMPTAGGDSHRTMRERALFGLLLAWNAYAQDKPLRSIKITSNDQMPAPRAMKRPKGDPGTGGRA